MDKLSDLKDVLESKEVLQYVDSALLVLRQGLFKMGHFIIKII